MMNSSSPTNALGGPSGLPNSQSPANTESALANALCGSDGIALPHTVASWPKNSREVLRVRLDTFKGQTIIDARAWYGESDNLKPGRGGLTLSVKHLPQLAAAITAALHTARRAGLLQEGGGA